MQVNSLHFCLKGMLFKLRTLRVVISDPRRGSFNIVIRFIFNSTTTRVFNRMEGLAFITLRAVTEPVEVRSFRLRSGNCFEADTFVPQSAN